MYEHTSFCLRSHHEKHAQQVGRESGPGGIGKSHYRSVDKCLDFISVTLWYDYVVIATQKFYSEAFEAVGHDSKIIIAYIFNVSSLPVIAAMPMKLPTSIISGSTVWVVP